MTKRTKNYEDDLVERLKDPSFSALYLENALADQEEGYQERFLIALGDVIKAFGVSRLAEKTGRNRQNLYRLFSEDGNPELRTLSEILNELGLRLKIAPIKHKRSRRSA
jgi:probable addiction module antidote protein